MKFSTKLRLMFHKAYFEKGESIIAYVKWIILFNAVIFTDTLSTGIYVVLYVGVAYVVGRLWFKWNFMEAENEVNNLVNKFMKEVRKDLLNNGGKKHENKR